MAAGAVASLLAVVVAVVPALVSAARRRRRVRRRWRRSSGPGSLPDAAVRLGVEEVHEAHRQLDVGALVAVDRVGAPALEQAVHQVAHAAAVLAGEQVAGEDELGVTSVVAGGQLLVQSLQVSQEFFPASTAVSSCQQTFAQCVMSSQHDFRKYLGRIARMKMRRFPHAATTLSSSASVAERRV